MATASSNVFQLEVAKEADRVCVEWGSGFTVTCHLSPKISAVDMEIRWFKGTDCVCLYKNRQVIEGRRYEDRLGMFSDDLERGNVSLNLTHFIESDEGDYLCQVISGDRMEEVTVKIKIYNKRRGTYTLWTYKTNKKWTEKERMKLEESSLMTENHTLQMKDMALKENVRLLKKTINELEQTTREVEKKQNQLEEKDTQLENMSKQMSEKEKLLESTIKEMETSKQQLETLTKELEKTSMQLQGMVFQLEEEQHIVPDSDFRLVILGRSGYGKSAVGNMILGIEEDIQTGTSTEIHKSESRQGEVAGRKVTVVETPDWFCSGLSLEELRQDVKLCLHLSAPGPHAFLLVIPVKESAGEMLEKMEEILGERCWRNTIILFTVTDEEQEKNIEEFVQSANQEVQRLVEKCENRFHCLNIDQSEDDSQVPRLLEAIDKMVAGNTVPFYSSEIYLQIHEMAKKIVKEITKIKERQQREISRKLDREMQEALHRFTTQIKLLDKRVNQIEERITKLERKIKEEKHEEIIKELKTELEREKQQRQITEEQLRECREQWEKERSEMEKRHLQEVEKIKETSKKDIMMMKVMAKLHIILSDILVCMTEEHKIKKTERKTLKQKLSKIRSESGEEEDVIETSAAPIRRNSMDEPPKMSEEASRPELESELRLVLLGSSESGKRSARNMILGKEERSQTGTSTESQQSESKQGEVAGRKVTVVKTPDWFCSGLSLEELRQDVRHCVCLSTPGPHAFLLVLPVQESTEEEREVQEKLEEIFGERCWRNTMILFTVTDEEHKKNIAEFVHSGNPEIQRLVEKCGNRFHCLNINQSKDDSQVPQLLEKIEMMIGGNTERLYSSEIYLVTESQIREMERKLRRERQERNRMSNQVEEKDREIEDLKSITSVHTETQENTCGIMNWVIKFCCCCCSQSYEILDS